MAQNVTLNCYFYRMQSYLGMSLFCVIFTARYSFNISNISYKHFLEKKKIKYFSYSFFIHLLRKYWNGKILKCNFTNPSSFF